KATSTAPAQVVRTCRGQLHSPVQAASVLARVFQLTGPHAYFRPGKTDHRSLASDLAADFKVGAWLEDLIQQQMREQDLPRDAVVESLIHLRPEIAKYLRELPGPQNQSAPISLPDATRRTDTILDFIATLATDPEASADNNPVAEAAHQIEAAAEMLDTGAITREAFGEAFGRIHSRLSEPERHDLRHHFQVKSIILHDITNQPSPNEASPHDPPPPPPPPPNPHPPPPPARTPPPPPKPKPPDSSPTLQPPTSNPQPTSTPASSSTVPTCERVNLPTPSSSPNLQPSTFNLQPTPTPDSRLKTPDSPS